MAINPLFLDENDVALQRRVNDMLDWGLLLSVAAALGMGLISIYSAAFGMGSDAIFKRQLLYAGVGIVSAMVLFFMPERMIRNLAYPLYGVGVLLLATVLTPLGHEVNGQRCWIQIGSFSFQPSEFAKISTLLAAAKLAGRKGFTIRSIRDAASMTGLFLLPVALIMMQPDTGSATVFLAMLLGVYLWVGGDLFLLYLIATAPFVAISALYGVLFDNMIWFIIVSALVTIGAFLFKRNLVVTIMACLMLIGAGLAVKPMFTQLEPYQQGRLVTLFEPERNPRGSGYHVIQSMLAVGSGGVTGKGFLKGTQTQLRYIPEQWTDFIFCVPTEEFGFVGGVVVIALLVSITFRALNIASLARSPFASVIAVGFVSLLTYHTLVNIGMAIGLFPVMGIPLPFLSAGGTSLIANIAVVGLMLNFYKTRRRRSART